jgi:hypothetical protein
MTDPPCACPEGFHVGPDGDCGDDDVE